MGQYINDPSKCIAKISKNFLVPDMTEEEEALEIAHLCAIVDPSGKKKIEHHWIISWKEEQGDRPLTKKEIFETVDEAMTELGYEKCPYRVAIHGNTDNPHAHIDVLRIDLEAQKLIPDSWDYVKAQRAVAKITAAHEGWRPEPGNWYKMQLDGKIVFHPEKPKKRGGIRTRTLETEKITGKKSLERTLQEFCEENREYFKAWKWADLHRGLALKGVEMQYTEHPDGGGGLAFSIDGKRWEKASTLCPELAFPRISEALGAKSKYRKARADTLKILSEARAKLEETKQPLDEVKDVHQQQGRNTGTPAGNNQPKSRTSKDSTAIPEESRGLGRPVERETSKLSGDEPQNRNRTSSQESDFKTGSMEYTGKTQQTRPMDQKNTETTRESSNGLNETNRSNTGQDNKLNARRGTGAEQRTTGNQGSARTIIQWSFTDESGNNENQKRNDKITTSLEEKTALQAAFLANQKKLAEKTAILHKKLNSLQTFYNLRYLKRKTLKEQRRQKFITLNKKLDNLKNYYDKKFIQSSFDQLNTHSEEDRTLNRGNHFQQFL